MKEIEVNMLDKKKFGIFGNTHVTANITWAKPMLLRHAISIQSFYLAEDIKKIYFSQTWF